MPSLSALSAHPSGGGCQTKCNDAILDCCALLREPRHCLGIVASSRGYLAGRISVRGEVRAKYGNCFLLELFFIFLQRLLANLLHSLLFLADMLGKRCSFTEKLSRGSTTGKTRGRREVPLA